jgi:hypothetical protein
MIGKLRSALIGLGLAASLALGTSIVGATAPVTTGSSSAQATLGAGTLTISNVTSTFAYPQLTLDGDTHDLVSSFDVAVNDASGSGAGWKLTAAIGTLTDLGQTPAPTIAPSNHTISSATSVTTSGTATANTVSPGQIPTSSAPIFSTPAGTGKGKSTETFNTALHIPADASHGTYSATLNITIASGP